MKKGFTLIELLFVIVLIGLLGLLIIPNVTKLVNDSSETVYQSQVKSIEDASLAFITDYYESVEDMDVFTIDLKLLKDLAFVEYEVKNPKTHKYFSDSSLVTFEKKNNKYEATFYPVDSDLVSDGIKYAKHFSVLKGYSSNIGNYMDTGNVVLIDFDGKLYTSGYIVNATNTSSTNIGYQKVTYNISFDDSTYSISRDEKES